MDCIFCKIINGEIPSYTIYEDKIVKVFLDVNPMSPGHMLIIPKKHYENLDDINMSTLTHLNVIAKKMHVLLKEKLNIDGMTIVQNNGEVQEVKHYHMHLKPYYKENNGITITQVYEKLMDCKKKNNPE
ncbi:MAG: HIT domain-containing protein [Bacilli bacterium]|nr:HIT domain-containing protein [Bacilli bacterium]